ncbi:hypothetical protein E2C01_059979 [Portunus trituberculatus]|uniref:Uncharacterized protein n=1 Tax=Portunus trituberculatus TaxID=210409 RepID=A0A5B7H6V3_PORTR|nr:hypothetical protein [Portunus trituberculatus]
MDYDSEPLGVSSGDRAPVGFVADLFVCWFRGLKHLPQTILRKCSALSLVCSSRSEITTKLQKFVKDETVTSI